MSTGNQNHFPEFEKLFWKLSREMGYLWKRIYEQTFPGSQSHILFLLERNGTKRMSELADALHLTPGAVTTASDRLIDHGYIDRIRDEKDRRVIYLELTQKGKETLNELQNEGRRIMRLVFNDISETDLKMMNYIFEQATINLDNIGGEYKQCFI